MSYCSLQSWRSSCWLTGISSDMDAKELINQTLDYYKYKINNDLCTMEEIQSVSEEIQRGNWRESSANWGVTDVGIKASSSP